MGDKDRVRIVFFLTPKNYGEIGVPTSQPQHLHIGFPSLFPWLWAQQWAATAAPSQASQVFWWCLDHLVMARGVLKSKMAKRGVTPATHLHSRASDYTVIQTWLCWEEIWSLKHPACNHGMLLHF